MAVSEVSSRQIKKEPDGVHFEEFDVGGSGSKEPEKQPGDEAAHEDASELKNHRFNRVSAMEGQGCEYFGRMMYLMKLPKEWNAVECPMDDIPTCIPRDE